MTAHTNSETQAKLRWNAYQPKNKMVRYLKTKRQLCRKYDDDNDNTCINVGIDTMYTVNRQLSF